MVLTLLFVVKTVEILLAPSKNDCHFVRCCFGDVAPSHSLVSGLGVELAGIDGAPAGRPMCPPLEGFGVKGVGLQSPGRTHGESAATGSAGGASPDGCRIHC